MIVIIGYGSFFLLTATQIFKIIREHRKEN